MIFIFCIFAAVLIFFSYKSFRGGIDYLNFFKKELAKKETNFTPFVTIFAPCRGLDEDLEENLSALFRQNFPHYEILFVVDDETDQAFEVIKKVSCKDAKNAVSKLIVAGKATDSAQKIHNLREAVLHASDESEIFVFVDSDARPAENWLRNLIAPLEDKKIGCATGYRWFISKKIGFASEMRAVWNASIASALGANLKKNFAWGGSMAMRRETFENLKIRKKWQGVLSDDFAVTRAMKAADLAIYFVPQALTASVENCNFRELLEFTTRQMKITRVYAQNFWIQAFTGAFIFNLVMIWAIFLILIYPFSSIYFWVAAAVFLTVSAFSIGKAFLRLKAVKLVLKNYENDLQKQFWTQNTLWILSPVLFLYNSICALFSRKIVWRGIFYKLDSPEKTSILLPKK